MPRNSVDGELRTLLSLCSQESDVDVDDLRRTARAYLQGFRARTDHPSRVELEDRWYRSLERGTPDWGVYDGVPYMAELWMCWVIYARRYLSAMTDPRVLRPYGVAAEFSDVPVVLDAGCGFGFSTAALRAMFPSATVIGTNLEGTMQYRIAARAASQFGFEVRPSFVGVQPGGLIFASEYFEHFEEPVSHLRDMIAAVRPRVLVVANSFTARSIGHFTAYRVDGEVVGGSDASRRFGGVLRSAGYERRPLRVWNGRPALWVSTGSQGNA